MKYLTPIAAAAIAVSSVAQAGTLSEPVIEEMVEAEAATSRSTGIIIPLLLIGALVLLVSQDDDSAPATPSPPR